MSTRVLTVLYMIYKLFNINSNKFISHLGYSIEPRHVLKKEKKIQYSRGLLIFMKSEEPKKPISGVTLPSVVNSNVRPGISRSAWEEPYSMFQKLFFINHGSTGV